MANYNHPQFTPEFNRLRGGGGGVGIMGEIKPPRVEQRSVDPDNPYFPVHTGLFTGSAPDNDSKERAYLFYIPTTIQPSGNSLFVFTSAGQSPMDCFKSANWAEMLEEYEAAAFFIAPDGDWDRENPGQELDYFLRVYAQARDLEYYASNDDALYAMGFGSGAYMATLFSLLYSSVFTAFAVEGSCGIENELLSLIGNLPSDGDASVKKSQNPMPAWILDYDGSGKPMVDYLKDACSASEENLHNDIARVWLQTPKAGELYLNEQAVTEVWYSEKNDYLSISKDELVHRMLKFLTRFKRWGGIGNNHLRLTKTPGDMGLIKKELLVDGLRRYWWVFEPSSYKKGSKSQYPLVVAIHGFSCSGAFFAENSSWEAVAEERGLLVAFPTAYPHLRKPRGKFIRHTCPTPAWNSFLGGDPNGPDDVKFIDALIQAMKSEYPIDPSRVYATGHSNGSAMVQLLMRKVPELFAAFGPIGAMEAGHGAGKPAPQPNDLIRPVWYMMGEYDLGDGDSLDKDKANYLTISNLCECNNTDLEGASHYESGIYKHLVAYSPERIPLVRFTGVSGWPHTATPETSLMMWDEFFCKFKRNPDGSIIYLG